MWCILYVHIDINIRLSDRIKNHLIDLNIIWRKTCMQSIKLRIFVSQKEVACILDNKNASELRLNTLKMFCISTQFYIYRIINVEENIIRMQNYLWIHLLFHKVLRRRKYSYHSFSAAKCMLTHSSIMTRTVRMGADNSGHFV